jgi:4-amino-4-deoxy-L-arabinose transferase-like glycosyltransferase
MKKVYLIIAMILVVATLSVYGCSTTTTRYLTTSPTTTITTTSTTQQPPTTWAWQPSPGNIINGGQWAYFPLNGAYVSSGRTLSLSWSADDNVECFIFTENQYNNFSQPHVEVTYQAHGTGSSGTISTNVVNSDSYYAVIRIEQMGGPSFKLYQATLTAR